MKSLRQVAAALRHLFQVLQRSPSNFTSSATAGRYSVDIFLLDNTYAMRRHIFRRQRIDIVVVQPQQFIGVERARELAHRTEEQRSLRG